MMMARPMRGSPVTMRRMTVTMRARGQLLPHERAAAAVPHDLPVGHAVARAHGPARKMERS